MILQDNLGKQNHYHYEVDPATKPLGVGGMGQVLRGVKVQEDTGTRQEVAIKFLFNDLPEHVIDRAKREASVQIQNENLVEMLGFLQVTDSNGIKRNHVVSELLHGVMLSDLLKGNVTDNLGEELPKASQLYEQYQNDRINFAIFIVKSVLSGLMALHNNGYIHRDLDPSNIMITHDGKVKIIDFGIAKRLDALDTQDQHLTSTGQFLGKPYYASPELVRGFVSDQNQTTDLYAVGIILYQLMTGNLPFDGPQNEVMQMQIHEKMPLKNVDDKKIRKIIEKATEKKQASRYQSAAEFIVDLENVTKTLTKTKPPQIGKLPPIPKVTGKDSGTVTLPPPTTGSGGSGPESKGLPQLAIWAILCTVGVILGIVLGILI